MVAETNSSGVNSATSCHSGFCSCRAHLRKPQVISFVALKPGKGELSETHMSQAALTTAAVAMSAPCKWTNKHGPKIEEYPRLPDTDG